MASPPPPPQAVFVPHQNLKATRITYYYFIVGLSLVAFVVLLTNAVFAGFFTWLRRFMSTRVFGNELTEEQMQRWIPAFRYLKKRSGGEDGDDGDSTAASECTVCITAFEEREEVRKLPQCGHSFHVACIDMWLSTHNNCPVCRCNVLPTNMPPVVPSISTDFTAELRENLSGHTISGTAVAVPES